MNIDIMRVRVIVFILFMVLAQTISVNAQKVTTTKPSVQQLLNVYNNPDPSSALFSLARTLNFDEEPDVYYLSTRGGLGGGKSCATSQKTVAGKAIFLWSSVLEPDSKIVIDAGCTSHNPKVAESWESQLKALGYHYDSHEADYGIRNTTLDTWYYSKPGKPKVKIVYIEYYEEYQLIVY